ncbi:MAG: anti-sigma factor antagonist [Frankiales bacterium]|nr:anti-sigma factor antagonist [Frankiales bacterium]
MTPSATKCTAAKRTKTRPRAAQAGGVVDVMTLADGLVVRLAGAFGTGDAGLLREALLRPRPAACNDILVDAGAVQSINDDALAVLVAAPAWAAATGGQLSFTRMSDELMTAAISLGVLARMPVLAAPGVRAR